MRSVFVVVAGVLADQAEQMALAEHNHVVKQLWVVLSRAWSRWVDVLAIVQPATVIAWHCRGFARFWAYKSRHRGGPPLASEVSTLMGCLLLAP